MCNQLLRKMKQETMSLGNIMRPIHICPQGQGTTYLECQLCSFLFFLFASQEAFWILAYLLGIYGNFIA